MRHGPKKLTPGEVKDQLFDAHRAYREGKEKLMEKSITVTESGTSKLLGPLFLGLLFMGWLVVVLWEPPNREIFDVTGFFSIALVFFLSYFAFFHLSKLIFKPSDEEAADDTSYFALFSACESRERRGLHSAVFGLANTVGLVLYAILNQTGLDAWRLF